MTSYRWTWALVWTATNVVFADGFADVMDATRFGRAGAGNEPGWAVRRMYLPSSP